MIVMAGNIQDRHTSILIRLLTCCIAFMLLISCEPREEKISRLSLDTYSQMINSVLAKVVEARAEEGFSGLAPGEHYSTTLARINEIDSGLNKFRFAQDYQHFSQMQHSIAAELRSYVEIRIRTALSMNEALNSKTGELESLKNAFLGNIELMDSVSARLDSLINDYNLKANESRLQERIVLPPLFTDTVNDFLLNNRSYILSLQPGN